MDPRILDLIATVIERCQGPSEPGPGHPPAATVRVLASLRRFVREGTPWRSLKATPAEASGSTLRRRLADWAAINLLQRVYAMLVAMLRSDPTLILDSCSVRAKRGGDLTGPNPTDRGKCGTKYHVAVTGDGVPVACAATGANVNDTVLFWEGADSTFYKNNNGQAKVTVTPILAPEIIKRAAAQQAQGK